jgi:hypothetical protein
MMQVKTPASAFVGGSDGIVMIGTPAPEETPASALVGGSDGIVIIETPAPEEKLMGLVKNYLTG